MTVRRIGRYTVTYRAGQVYLVDDAVDADCDLTPDDAISLGEALLLAAREAVRTDTYVEPPCMCAGQSWSTTSGRSRP
jgi:hypothetical protein